MLKNIYRISCTWANSVIWARIFFRVPVVLKVVKNKYYHRPNDLPLPFLPFCQLLVSHCNIIIANTANRTVRE